MVEPCCGLMGRLFGHKIDSVLRMSIPPTPELLNTIDPQVILYGEYERIIVRLRRNEYRILCVRCGKRFDNAEQTGN